jgi:protein-S-isoprenylcysteine O-methyltransferase Ste14
MLISQIFRGVWICWIASEVVIAVATRTRGDKGNVRDRGSMLLLWIAITGGITACEWISAVVVAPLVGGRNWLGLVSLIVLLAGLVIRWSAVLTLGKAFSANVAIREAQELKQTGLYRLVRHPSYSGLLLVLLAIGIHSRNWIAFLALMVPATAAIIYRIHIEEAALCEAFGERYTEYKKASQRLLPGLY